MRVLTVTNWYPPHHYGGYELSCFDVMTRLDERGHEAHVLCGDTLLGPDRVATHPEHESRVRRSLRLYHDGTDLLRPSWRDRLAIERHNQRQLARALEEVQPDVVSVWHLAGLSHGLLDTLVRSGTPLVFGLYDDWLVYGLRIDPWAEPFNRSSVRRLLGRLVGRVAGVPCVVPDISSAGTFLFTTRATEGTALAKSRWHPERRAIVWGGIDLTLFTAPTGPPSDWSWRLITTGRFDARKGFETVIRALPLLPESATLACWGRGGDEERARLEGIAETLGVADRVQFGSLDREDLPGRYKASDVMVFPSIWAEPFGLVPIEAMACGVPVLATGVGGSSEFLVDEGNCLLFPAEDHEALADGIRRLATDPSLRDRIVANALQTAAELDVELLADVMEAWHVYEAEGRAGEPPAERPNPGASQEPSR